MKEEWRFYKDTRITKAGYKNKKGAEYYISNYGRLKENGTIIEPKVYSKIYHYLRYKGITIHRAVAEVFILNPENKPYVDHIDNNKYNNKVDNLRWVTAKENMNNPITKNRISKTLIGHPVSEETKNKISEAIKNRPPISEETRKKLSEKNSGINNGFYGKNHTEETKNKISLANKGNKCPTKGKHKVWDNKELNKFHFE